METRTAVCVSSSIYCLFPVPGTAEVGLAAVHVTAIAGAGPGLDRATVGTKSRPEGRDKDPVDRSDKVGKKD